MAFSEWQQARLRSRLAAYRLNTGKTWLDLAQEILLCQATALSIPDDDADEQDVDDAEGCRTALDWNWPIKAESLRRFVVGESRKKNKSPTQPEHKKLEAYRDFLMHVRYLSARELEEHEIDLKAAYVFLDFLQSGRHVTENAPAPDGIEGQFVSVTQESRLIREASLEIRMSEDRQVLLVEESEDVYDDPKHLPFERWRQAERRYNFRYSRRLAGWGVRGGTRVVYIFLKSIDAASEHHSYLAADFGSSPASAGMLLIRYPSTKDLKNVGPPEAWEVGDAFARRVDDALLAHFVAFQRRMDVPEKK